MSYRLVYVAGDANVIAEECGSRLARLRDEGFDVEVAAPESPALEKLETLGISTRSLPGRDGGNVASWLASYFILQGDFIESPPALVHGLGTPWSWVAAYAARQARVPAVFATVESHRLHGDDGRLAALLRQLPRALSSNAPHHSAVYRLLGKWVDGYLLHDEADLERLLADDLVSPAKLDLVIGANGVDLSLYDPRREEAPTVAEARATHHIPTGYRALVGARSPSTEVGRARLKEIQDRLARTHPSVGWLMLGDNSAVEGISASAANPTFFRAIDCYLEVESTPRPTNFMRAAAMKVPVVATRARPASSIVVDYETGRLAQPTALGDVLVEVLGDPKRANDMGVRARARAEQRFDRLHIDEQILRIYDRVLSRAISE